MQVASTRRRRKAPPAALVLDEARPAPLRLTDAEEAISSFARQDYLDALPIAAAIVAAPEGGPVTVDAANGRFETLARRAPVCGLSVQHLPLLGRSTISQALTDFLATDIKSREFDGHDGQPIGGRHFTVRLARLGAKRDGTPRCLISLIDKTAQVETEKSLRAEMLRDSLTGLPNRLAFNERVEEILEHPNFRDGSYAVVVIDMTRFSRVNECMGALAGDELLITFARRLFSTLRAGDVLARTGGDEFAILMRLDRGIGEAMELAERIRSVLETPFRLSELEIRVDCSVGCALLARGIELAEEVLRNAQFALKQSKQSGRAEVYEPIQAQAAIRRFSIETELRRVIDNDGLKLAFQPLIDLATGTVSGFEALARWENEERGAISPNEFIPIAEESGLIVPLGRWALDAAARTLADWDRQAGRVLPVSVAVNLSPIQIARDDVAAAAEAALRAAKLSGSRLTLELTESVIIQDPQRATSVLEALKGLDARIAMDDFGTGYTSLSYLQRLPIDVLKIDQSFVSGMLRDGDSNAIVRAILSLARALGMSTTAEGIESAELARTLAELGCSQGQGFFYAQPLSSAEALAYCLSRSN
jgi:diguanylate cyclase (GGDEF)-like protein